MDGIFEQYDVHILAPSHGNPIREDFKKYIPLIQEGMRQAVEMPYSNVL